jgi:hypothetical protein
MNRGARGLPASILIYTRSLGPHVGLHQFYAKIKALVIVEALLVLRGLCPYVVIGGGANVS